MNFKSVEKNSNWARFRYCIFLVAISVLLVLIAEATPRKDLNEI